MECYGVKSDGMTGKLKPGRKKGTANKQWNKRPGVVRNKSILIRASTGLVDAIAELQKAFPAGTSVSDIIHEAVKDKMYRSCSARHTSIERMNEIESRF